MQPLLRSAAAFAALVLRNDSGTAQTPDAACVEICPVGGRPRMELKLWRFTFVALPLTVACGCGRIGYEALPESVLTADGAPRVADASVADTSKDGTPSAPNAPEAGGDAGPDVRSDAAIGAACTASACTCADAGACALDCGSAAYCAPTCTTFSGQCGAQCADHCDFQCTAGTNCNVSCGDSCRIECTSTHTCEATCGTACNYSCTSVNDCALIVGDSSTVTCTSAKSCDVTCQGTCRVHCVSVVNCNVGCPAALTPVQCSDGWACGEGC